MKVDLIRIGNSKGIRIPASVIKQLGLQDKLELRVEDGVILLSPAHRAREGWAEAFQRMAEAGDDALLIPDAFEDEVHDEDWTWRARRVASTSG